MKTVYNTSATKTINLEHEGEVYNVESFKRLEVPDEVADKISKEWKEAQITEVSSEAEPWELKVLPSLPPEMQAKVKFKTPKTLVGARELEVQEVAQPMDEAQSAKLGKPANLHVCPRGCGYSSPYLVATRKHMKACAPRPATEEV